MHGPTTNANDQPSYFPPQPTAPAGTSMSERQQHFQQYEGSDAQMSQPASASGNTLNHAGQAPAIVLDEHRPLQYQHQQQHMPITTTTNRHVSDYSDSFEWDGASAGHNISAQRYTSHPNSSTDSFYQPLSFGTHHRQHTSSSSPFGSFSDPQSNYFAQPGISGVAGAPAAASQNVSQFAAANTHNVFAESGTSHPSVLASSSNAAAHHQQSSSSFMAIDTSVSSSRLEQESEGYLSPSSSEPTAATPDPSQFFSPSHHQNSRDGTHASLSTFGRSASPSPSITYTPTSHNAVYNPSSTFSPPSASYRHANYSSSGGLSDSSMDESSASLAHSSNNPLLKQELHRNGKPKRPLNSFMIFARQRRPDLQKLNPNMKVADIAKELSKEWKDMPADQKKEYFEAAKVVKESFHKMHPDYVYSRRPNGSRKSGGGGGSASTSGHRRRASSATPSSSGSTTGGGTAADIGESASVLSHTLSLSSPPSANHHTTPSSHRGKTRSRPLAGSKGAGVSGGGGGGGHHSGVRSSDSEKSAFSPGYESNTSDAEIGNLHMPMPMPMPTQLSQSFSFPSSAGTTAAAREGDAAVTFRSLAAGYEPQIPSNNVSSASESMDYDAAPLQQTQMSSSTSSAPGYLETHMSATPQDYCGPQNAVQSFEEQLLSQPISSGSQSVSHGQPSGSAHEASLQSSIYPSSSSIAQQQIPASNIFATPQPKQQQSFAAVSNQGQDHTVQEHARPLTSQSGYSQAASYQAPANSGNQARPSSTSRFGIHSFRNAGSSSAKTSVSLVDQHDVQSYGEESSFVAQQQRYQQRANDIFKEPLASSQTPSVSATVRAAMNSPSRLSMRSLQSFPDLSINTMSAQPHQQQQMSWMHPPSVTSPAVAPGHRYTGYDPPQNVPGMSMDDSYIHDSGGSWLYSGPGKPIESPSGIVRMNSPPPAQFLRHSASTFSLPADRQGSGRGSMLHQSITRPSGISQIFARARSPSRGSLSSEESTGPAMPRDSRSGRVQAPLLNPYAAYGSALHTASQVQPGQATEAPSSTSYFSASGTSASAPPTARSESFLAPQTPFSSSSLSTSGLAKSARANRRGRLLAGDRLDREGSYASSTGATTSSERASSVSARASGLVYNGTGKARYTPISYNETSVSRSYPHEAYAPAIRTTKQAPLPAPSNSKTYIPGTPITLAPLRRDSVQMSAAGDAKEVEQTRLPSLADNLDATSILTGGRQPYTDYVQAQDASCIMPP